MVQIIRHRQEVDGIDALLHRTTEALTWLKHITLA